MARADRFIVNSLENRPLLGLSLTDDFNGDNAVPFIPKIAGLSLPAANSVTIDNHLFASRKCPTLSPVLPGPMPIG